MATGISVLVSEPRFEGPSLSSSSGNYLQSPSTLCYTCLVIAGGEKIGFSGQSQLPALPTKPIVPPPATTGGYIMTQMDYRGC